MATDLELAPNCKEGVKIGGESQTATQRWPDPFPQMQNKWSSTPETLVLSLLERPYKNSRLPSVAKQKLPQLDVVRTIYRAHQAQEDDRSVAISSKGISSGQFWIPWDNGFWGLTQI